MNDSQTSRQAGPARSREYAILEVVIAEHPTRLTVAELTSVVPGRRSTAQTASDVADGLEELRCSGLIRRVGEIVEPTYAALRAAEIFQVGVPIAAVPTAAGEP